MIISSVKGAVVTLQIQDRTAILSAYGDFQALNEGEFKAMAYQLSCRLQQIDAAFFTTQDAQVSANMGHYFKAGEVFSRRLPSGFRMGWFVRPEHTPQIRKLTSAASCRGYVKMAAFSTASNAANFIHRPGLTLAA